VAEPHRLRPPSKSGGAPPRYKTQATFHTCWQLQSEAFTWSRMQDYLAPCPCPTTFPVAAAWSLQYRFFRNQMALFRTLFWTVIFLASTFAFTVLFEHGPTNFAQNARKEADVLKAMMSTKPVQRQKDGSDKLTPPTTR